MIKFKPILEELSAFLEEDEAPETDSISDVFHNPDAVTEGYKWKPAKTQARKFAQRMSSDPEFKAEYEAKQEFKAQKRREGSKFDYQTAGGSYPPTDYQAGMAEKALRSVELTEQERSACEAVVSAFFSNEKTHHDNIHVVNELIRSHRVESS